MREPPEQGIEARSGTKSIVMSFALRDDEQMEMLEIL